MKFFFIKLGNLSSLDPTRERAKRSLAVSKDVRMGPTLDAWRGQGDAAFPRHHRRLTSGMLSFAAHAIYLCSDCFHNQLCPRTWSHPWLSPSFLLKQHKASQWRVALHFYTQRAYISYCTAYWQVSSARGIWGWGRTPGPFRDEKMFDGDGQTCSA